MHRGAALVTLAALAALGEANFLSSGQLASQTCYSQVYQTVSTLTVSNPPVSPIDVLDYPGVLSSFELLCFQVVESLSNPGQLSSSQAAACQSTVAALSICIAPYNGPGTTLVWSCSSLSDYASNPATTTEYSPPAGSSSMQIKFEWLPQATSPACYPLDLTVLVIGHQPSVQSPSLAASVVFIVIVVIVGAGAAVFGIYQVRKSMKLFKRGEREEQLPDDVIDKQLESHMDVADDQVAGPDAAAYTITDANEVLESRPFPKPWYERNNYDLGRQMDHDSSQAPPPGFDSRRLDFNSPDSRQQPSSATRRRLTPGGQRQQSPQQQQQQSPQQQQQPAHLPVRYGEPVRRPLHYQPEHTDAADVYNSSDSDEVLVCGDCGLEIHHPSTTQLCHMTGKRHY